jgi:3-hydroxyisobutyrate dehydrogenase-like beta-hydroxyacid dehydrogenase
MQLHKVGFIGLGRMGRGMAANLVAAGVDLVVHDQLAPARDALRERGAAVAADAAAVAEACELVFLCLPFAPEVREALFGPRGVRDGARPGLTVVDTTTLDHRDAQRIAEEASSERIAYVDCPISGMPFRAENGTLTMMFGGDEALFSSVRPLLEHMGEFIVHCGPVGSGQAMKALNNIVYDVNIAAFCEVLPLAVKFGLDVDTVARVLTSGTSRSFASEYFVPRILERGFDTDFSMGAAYKDIVNVQEIAGRLHASTPVINAMVATYQTAMAMGYAEEPKSAMSKVYERVLGIEVKGKGDGQADG